jgi:lipid-A-disaccharide synthase
MRYYIIAGEASGDLHGSNLIKAMQVQDPTAELRCWGGDKMQAAGATVVKHIRDLAFMGFVEVAMHLPTILGNIRFCKEDILRYKPDVLVLIDYPGFNLRIAEWAKRKGIKVCYYISPQIWAWKEGRVASIKRNVDKMLVILPFEKSFYKKHGLEVIYTGHPLTDVVDAALTTPAQPIAEKPIIAVLPGSRKQEIAKKLPIMLKAIQHFPQYTFAIGMAPAQDVAFYKEIIQQHNVVLVNDTYNLLKQAKAALVTSGTATLETALFGVPQVVCYKGNPLSYWLAKRLIKVKYISLVNLILDKQAVTELIQHDLSEHNVVQELQLLLDDKEKQERIQSDYTLLWQMLGAEKASEKAAAEVVALAKSS